MVFFQRCFHLEQHCFHLDREFSCSSNISNWSSRVLNSIYSSHIELLFLRLACTLSVSNEDILITLAWSDWEPFCLICIIFSRKITCLEKDNIVFSDCVAWGKWSCSGSWFNCMTFSCVDMRPLRGCWRWPSMVDCFSWGVCEPGPLIGLAKKWRSFWWLLSPILSDWGSNMMRGGSPLKSFSICARKRSPKNICQEFWTLSWGYFAGSSSTCKG